MSRVAVLALTFLVLPEACNKLLAKRAGGASAERPVASAAASSSAPSAPTPSSAAAPGPAPAATTPPVWTPPDDLGVRGAPGGDRSTDASAPVAADTAKAVAAADAGDHKRVRVLLEKKVRAGRGTPTDVKLVLDACTALKDKPCADAARARL